MSKSIQETIFELFSLRPQITSGDVAVAAGVSRQAAHYHFKKLQKSGLVRQEGAGRTAHYVRCSLRSARYGIQGLSESDVWTLEHRALKDLDPMILDNPALVANLNFTFTEMVNNAIEHSAGTAIEIRWFLAEGTMAFEVEDDGIGTFRRMRESRGLARDFDAIGEIAKGRQTTDPAHHSGLGIYLSSRLADRFILSSGNLTWTTDLERDDAAVGWLDEKRNGTLVRCEMLGSTVRTLHDVLNDMTDPEVIGSKKSRILVDLFSGDGFVSRTQAKTLATRLEIFDQVEIDFRGVREIGQGFADELFRVWQTQHPGTRLVPVNANPAILGVIGLTVAEVSRIAPQAGETSQVESNPSAEPGQP
ncbi:MAG: DUF4325 domain-containing protein [Actinomycetes bacterium]